MSTILDALRRAEAERGRGGVPGLHAQTLPTAVAPPPSAAAGRGWRGPWAVAAWVTVGAVGALVWWRSTADRGPAAAEPAPPTALMPGVALQPPSPLVPTVPMAAAPVPAPMPAPTSTAATPVPALPATGLAGAPNPVAVAGAGAGLAPTPAAPRPAPTPATAPLPAAVPLAALSESQRRQWPPLAIGGSVYSESAGSRFVIVNGQVVREGEAAAAGVTVERIGPRAAVLRWGELRVEVPL